MHDNRGQKAEAIGGNIFSIKDGVIHTRTRDRLLNGITRQAVIELAKRRRIEVAGQAIFPEELHRYSECFLTGSSAQVTPRTKSGLIAAARDSF